MVKKLLSWLMLTVLLLNSACTAASTSMTEKPGSAEGKTLTVLAAASLTQAFEELGEQFKAARPGVEISFNFAGSQQLAQQLANGAPADVFASANNRQMEAVVAAGRVGANSIQVFARNRLVVIYPTDNPAGIQQLGDLSKPGLKLVLAAKEVPVGQYSLEFLAKTAADPAFGSGYEQSVLNNVVSYEDNVRAVLTRVGLGEADAGIVYTSDVSGDAAQKVGTLEIPDALNVIAAYPIAPIQDSPNAALAQEFINLVLSEGGQALLAQHGFVPVQAASR